MVILGESNYFWGAKRCKTYKKHCYEWSHSDQCSQLWPKLRKLRPYTTWLSFLEHKCRNFWLFPHQNTRNTDSSLTLTLNNTSVLSPNISSPRPPRLTSFLNLLLNRPNNESAFYSTNSSRSFSSPQPSSHPSALSSSWPREPCLGGGPPGPRTSSVAPGSQRTCQVQHGLRPTALSWDGSSWGWSTGAERRRERERDKKEKRGGRLKRRERRGSKEREERERDMEGGLWETLLHNVGK